MNTEDWGNIFKDLLIAIQFKQTWSAKFNHKCNRRSNQQWKWHLGGWLRLYGWRTYPAASDTTRAAGCFLKGEKSHRLLSSASLWSVMTVAYAACVRGGLCVCVFVHAGGRLHRETFIYLIFPIFKCWSRRLLWTVFLCVCLCRKTDRAATVSSPRSFWRTTTQRWGTPAMRGGTWPSPDVGGRGKARGHASTNERSISWRGCRRGSSPPTRATTVLSISSIIPSVKGLNVRDTRQNTEDGEEDRKDGEKEEKLTDWITSSRHTPLLSKKNL